MRIAILDDYQDAVRTLTCFAKLNEHEVAVFNDHERDPAQLAERLKDFDALVLIQQRCPLPRVVIEQLPRLRLISQTGRNASHIDVAAATERGVVVSAGGAGNPTAPAELTWALILAALRHIPKEVEALKRGRWQLTLGTGLSGRVLGVYAFGKIGSRVADVGRAFGMRVLCFGREASTARARAAGFDVVRSRQEFFQSCDVLSLHLPLSAETRGIVTASDLAQMKSSALLVNTSRAGLIGDAVLIEALRNGRPGFAAVDVYDDEPVVGGAHPLLKMENVLCAPHLGYVEHDTYEMYLGAAFDQVNAYAAGRPINVVNPAALERR